MSSIDSKALHAMGCVYGGQALPAGFLCPICKDGAVFFEPLPSQSL